MNINDVFSSSGFGVISLSQKISVMPNQYGLLTSMGLFTPEPVSNRVVAVDFDPVTLTILPQKPWGSSGTANKGEKPYTKAFSIPHFPLEDAIMAGDLQSIRMPGGNDTVTASYLMDKKLREMKSKLEQTTEWLQLGALKGSITDGLGTVIYNPYTDFGISQEEPSFELDVAGTDVPALCVAAKRLILAALKGESITGISALCSDEFYDAFIAHSSVKDAYKYFQTNRPPSSDQTTSFEFGGIKWINYTGSVTNAAGSSVPMVTADKALIFPTGTSAFKLWYAPADYMETVNTPGLPFYARQQVMDYNKGVNVETQTNPFPICLKPACILKAKKT
jgi:hypothetical protein